MHEDTGAAYRDKLRSIGTVGRAGDRRETVERHGNVLVKTTEHADGRQDVTVRPDTARLEAVRHRTGRKRGDIAEIRRKGDR